MSAELEEFADRFRAIMGFTPYSWQTEVYKRMVDGFFDNLKLPTGTGKTSVMAIWLLALVKKAEIGRLQGFPRRLIWVVDRRTVVDQATAQAENIRRRLSDQSLVTVRRTLASLSATGEDAGGVVAVSTLRGELADNGEWKADPSKPAIIVGTVDMVGSRLLFSGYGDGRWHRPLHAGLLGVDTLFVLDEAHLSIPFGRLLEKISEINKPEKMGLPPFRVMQLSATLDREGDEYALRLLAAENNSYLAGVLGARKTLILDNPENKRVQNVDRLVELAVKLGEEKRGCRILVYTTSPDDVLAIRNKIGKRCGENMVVALTGTIRGYERDRLLEHPVFKRFLQKKDQGGETVYLVANSAGEVGIDMYADHMVCDLAPADRMIQRLGRVNRAGLGEAIIYVVKTKSKEGKLREKVLQNTWEYLKKVANDASPLALLRNPPPKEALEPRPAYPPLQTWILDAWSLTSLDQWPARPEVETWLRGIEDSLPDVYFVWRDNVDSLILLDEDKLSKVIINYPPQTREVLRENLPDARKKLIRLAERVPNGSVIILSYSGNVTWKGALKDLQELVRNNGIWLGYSTLLLSTACGGLNKGFLDPEFAPPATDVSDLINERLHGRLRFINDKYSWEFNSSELAEFNGVEFSSLKDALAQIRRKTGLEPYLEKIPSEESDEWLAYFTRRVSEDDPSSATRMTLLDHHTQTEWWAKQIVQKVNLPDEYAAAVVSAAANHDLGKKRAVWQHYAKNNNNSEPLAKSDEYDDPRSLKGYRHEFGSVVELSNAASELTLHLVASHHGYARPVYPERAYDPDNPQQGIKEIQTAPLRFASLQRKHGWWALAYLEALLKSADVMASKVNSSE